MPTNVAGRPVSIEELWLSVENNVPIEWKEGSSRFSRHLWVYIYDDPFTFVYGLYSRHGKFYPPYNFVPDINYKTWLIEINDNPMGIINSDPEPIKQMKRNMVGPHHLIQMR